MSSAEAVIIPVGMSPVHCLRLARKFIDLDFSLIVLVVTKETSDFADSIISIQSGFEGKFVSVYVQDISDQIESRKDIHQWSVVFGPGTREMQISVWHDVILATGNSPKNWIDHRRKSQAGLKNISPEMLVNLSDGFKGHELSQVTKEDALAVNSISTDTYDEIVGIRWIDNQSKFSLHISLPDGYEEIKRKKIRAWEESVYSRVVSAREIFGKHALIVTRDTFPSQPAWWSNVEKRMREYGIRGGSK